MHLFFFRYLYAPCFSLGFTGLSVWLVGHWPMGLWCLPVLLLLAIGLSMLAEALAPYERQWNLNHGDIGRDRLHALVNEALNCVGILSIPLFARLLPDNTLWPHTLPLWLQVLIAIVVADLGITLMHWLSHRSALLWRLHAVHHSVRRMYGLNGLMKHPLHQGLEALAGTLPLLLAGMPVTVAALLAFAIAIQLLLQHSNVDMRIGALRHLIAWAPVHRFHHLRYGRAGDVNFAMFFCLWDRLLGTAFDSPYKVGSKDLGIGSQPEYPDGYLAQLLEPFVCRARSERSPAPPAELRGSVEQL
ncbi:sterol desaturase family protein [Pseudomonas yangonensis]|uniref:sterol desaturase family protein n=1 Tax=Pseudomonas yangonensis TaxID=2579922 RepID=UPI001379E260|nr:sterol desaturase family protein [Pseudomonas yangonensis]